ncbi:LysR substrate-binding domain-containing protein [Chachezhania sediminis]|uniref:LysR substrate-binding domain-containing protein n=1 Tax=Chachezhania sediminis TaxID=2599291 RepID=UPI00131CE953|nr:LysR substrate-binding domain-containing protein [Chachezhania sediminis]
MSLKLAQLRYVVAAAEEGSLRAAARKLGIGQPAISRSMNEIERSLGAPLFERHQQGIRLTSAGRAFVLRAQTVLSELRKAEEEVRQINGDLTGLVSIAMSPATMFNLMPGALSAFRKQYPRAQVQVTESLFESVEQLLLRGQIDFFVGPFNETTIQPSFKCECLHRNFRAVIARKGHPLSGASDLKDLVDAEWVKAAPLNQASEADYDLIFKQQNLPPPKVVMETGSSIAALVAVASTDLLAYLPPAIIRTPLDTDLLQILLPNAVLQTPPICIVRRADLPLTPLAEFLSDMFRRAGLQFSRRLP